MPSVSPAIAAMPGWPSSATASASRNSALRPPRPWPRTVTVVSPPDSSTAGGGNGWPCARDLPRDAGMHQGDVARLALDASPRTMGVSAGACGRSAAACSAACGVRDDAGLACGEGADRRASASRSRASSACAQRGPAVRCRIWRGPRAHRRGWWIGDGRAGGDHRRIVARHVGDQQRHDPRRSAAAASRPPLIARQVLAHAIHLGDVGAAFQQRLVHRLLVGQGQAGAGSASSAEPPPEIRHSTRSSAVSPCRPAPGCGARPAGRRRRAPDARPRRPRSAGRAGRGRSA